MFVAQPGEQWIRPRAPFRFSAVPDRVMMPAPELGAHSGDFEPPRPPARDEGPMSLEEPPLAGLKVLDFTQFWSGPWATAWLVAMGAEVIKVESIQRPDGIRFSSAIKPKQDERYFEMTALFHATNLGKKDVTLDLGHPDGLALIKRLIERSDVVVENFTPRVMDGFGLSYDEVRELRPDVVYLRLPAFGLVRPVARPSGLRPDDGAAHRDGLDDRVRRRPADHPGRLRRPRGRHPHRDRARWPPSTIAITPARASWSRCP